MKRFAVYGLQGADDEQKNHHAERADQQRRTSSPFVQEDYSRKRKSDVQDILNRGCEQYVANPGGQHDVYHVVHPDTERSAIAHDSGDFILHDVDARKLRPHLN